MKKIAVVIVIIVLLGLVLAGFGGWQYRQGEVDRFRQEADYYKQTMLDRGEQLREVAEELENTQTELQQTGLELKEAEDQLENTQIELQQTGLELKEAQDQLKNTQTELQRTGLDLKEAEDKLANLAAELENTQTELQQTGLELKEAEDQLENTQTELQQTGLELKEAQDQLKNTQIELQQTGLELKEAQDQLANFKDIFQLPWITEQKILRQFGVKVSGETRDKLNWQGVKTGDYDLTPDELLIIFNVLSSLPPEIVASIRSITVVYGDTPGAGYYNWDGDIVIFGTPDKRGNNSTTRVRFIYVLYHEIGHIIDFSVLSSDERKEFYTLYSQSQDEKDFADPYGKSYPWEDFAEVFASYLMDTKALLKKAEESSLLKAKVEFVSRFFDQYHYKVEKRGDIIRRRGGEETIWPYRSRTNPEIETTLK